VSKLERCELAGQLKVDLAVSIHVNALNGVEKVHGVESYYLSEKTFLPPTRQGGFLFVCNNRDRILAKRADKLLQRNISLSKQLAYTVQNSILNAAKVNKIHVFNRGVKREDFRILLSCQIPVALIEVGFLTNREEARRLRSEKYQKILAQGIASGIMKYVSLM
jgi:N-acetylmuramoyl-L-alanine amidase